MSIVHLVSFVYVEGRPNINTLYILYPCLKQHDSITKTSLLSRLQAQTLPDATPPIGKIHPFSKMDVTFEPLMGV